MRFAFFVLLAGTVGGCVALLGPAEAAGNYHPRHAALPATLFQPTNWSLYTARIPQPQPPHAARRAKRHRHAAKSSMAWATFAYDNGRTAWNPNEAVLNASNVNASTFGMLYSEPVDGEVYAQPLFYPQVNVQGQGVHDLLLIATEGDSVYAFDAEAGTQLWKTTYVDPPFMNTFDPSVCDCSNIAFQQGITGTPVIDPQTQVMYFVTKTVEGGTSGTTHYRLHAVSLQTGHEVAPNADITASAEASDGTEVLLDPVWSIQRPGLVLSKNIVYVTFGSGADYHPANTSGWLIAFDKKNLRKMAQFSDELGDSQVQQIWYDGQVPVRLGTFWASGAAPAADAKGNLYVQGGNGAWDGVADFAMSVMQVPRSLMGVSSYFTPSTWQGDSDGDADLGSAGVVLLPPQAGKVRNVVIGGGKTGLTYVMDEQGLGGYNPSGDRILSEQTTNNGLWGTEAAYVGPNNKMYLIVPGGGPMTLWQVLPGEHTSLAFMSETSEHFSDYDDAGSEPVISSDGTQAGTAIVWAYSRVGTGGPAQLTLRAFDASNLNNELVELPFTNWQGGGELIAPSVANGMVFTAGEGNVSAYGLL